MADLKEKVSQIITLQGPITVSQYMMLALADPDKGYYQTENPFGRNGDFITAPEVSQMFGELIGIWVLDSWLRLDKPNAFTLCELGPGRGTLMNDVLRTITKLNPNCFNSAHIALVETSKSLAKEQKTRLSHYGASINWLQDFSEIGTAPLILFANELLDAIPIDQFVKQNGEWHERLITKNRNDELIFISGSNKLSSKTLPMKYHALPDGSILEVAPLRNNLVEKITGHLATNRGSALFIDYGSAGLPFGDTLQAVSSHQYKTVFDAPGKHDLTSHVDFSSLQVVAKKQNCETALLEQGEFLLRMGLLERAGQLGANKSSEIQNKIRSQVERLAAPQQMGKLFKVLAISDKITGLNQVFCTDNSCLKQ